MPIEIRIGSLKYKLIEKAAARWWGNSKKGVYAMGFKGGLSDPYKVARIGLLGEVAFGEVLGIDADLSYRRGGDKYDFMPIAGLDIDVKTASSPDAKVFLTYHETFNTNPPHKKSNNYLHRLNSFYVGCKLMNDDQEHKNAIVMIFGYITAEKVKECALIKENVRGTGTNYEIPFAKLNPIESFVRDINEILYDKEGMLP